MTGQVDREDPPPGVDLAQLSERGLPHGVVEGQPVQQKQRRLLIGIPFEASGQAGERLCHGLVAALGGTSRCHHALPVIGVRRKA